MESGREPSGTLWLIKPMSFTPEIRERVKRQFQPRDKLVVTVHITPYLLDVYPREGVGLLRIEQRVVFGPSDQQMVKLVFDVAGVFIFGSVFERADVLQPEVYTHLLA